MKLIRMILIILSLMTAPLFVFAQIQPYAPVSPALEKAATIYNRITGVKKGIDRAPLPQMAALIEQGQLEEAAALATAENAFYSNTLRLMGTRMSNKEESYKAPMSDTTAMLIGITKDDESAKRLLDSDYFYRFDLPNVDSDLNGDILSSNNHYDQAYDQMIDDPSLDVAASLVREPQSLRVGDNTQAHPDPSGILSLREFNAQCSNMGTNRRCYEETFKKFMCVGLEEISDSSAPDSRVAIDVSRAPGGDTGLFQTTCRGCHGNMDAMRGAFARIEFDDDFVKHGSVSNDNMFDNNGVAEKFNRGEEDGFSAGFRTTDGSWVNQMTTGPLGSFMGWRTPAGEAITTPIQGTGLRSFGKMIADSEAFSRCMVKQVYQTVCGRQVDVGEAQWVKDTATTFEIRGRKIKWLFEKVATDPACIGR